VFARRGAPDQGHRLRHVEPVDLTAAPGDPRLFIVEQIGRIRILDHGKLRTEPFLDLRGQVSGGNEQGLLGMAFHPHYRDNGFVFVNYTDRRGDTHVVRYHVRADRNAVDPASATTILFVRQPYSNHNGGQLLFGPDGMLYVPLGDGGKGGDPASQRPEPRRAARQDPAPRRRPRQPLRDPGRQSVRPSRGCATRGVGVRSTQSVAHRVRPPGRVAVHRRRRAERVGRGRRRAGEARRARLRLERVGGTHRYDASVAIDPPPLGPAIDYPHANGCCVIGGRVYRGSVAALRGLYFYADECGGWLASFRWNGSAAVERVTWTTAPRITPTAFGEDAAGELYVLDLGGKVLRITGTR
jgi:hypothetical protein